MNKKWVWAVLGPVFLGGALACGAGGDDEKSVDGAVAQAAPEGSTKAAGDGGEKAPDGVYKFGQTVRFKDGSTLTVGKPVTFKRDRFAVGGDGKKVFLKFKSTFTNKTKEVFDPALTSASASSDGTEAESVFQEGLDAPDNKVLPGKSVTWWSGYGFDSKKDVQLEVTMGFLDYDGIIFTG